MKDKMKTIDTEIYTVEDEVSRATASNDLSLPDPDEAEAAKILKANERKRNKKLKVETVTE
jgi:hypothetical protein